MMTLRERIQDLRCCNVDSKYFVPTESLDEVLTVSFIEQEVKRCVSKVYRQDEVAQSISNGGGRTFAILVLMKRPELILNFVENDQLLNIPFDSKLPFSKSRLEAILPRTDAIDFHEKQWEFTAPVFTVRRGHRLLDDNTIFPFLSREVRGGGGFGLVRDIVVHPKHGKYAVNSESKVVVVQKQLLEKPPQGTDAFNRELDVLYFLNTIQHPNIVELLGTYTFDKTHYLLFPPAAYDLKELITGENYTNPYQSEMQFLFALSGLASAIETMHDCTSRTLDIRMIGCHHDLKPGNILVEGRTLLLADFGLSSLKRTSEDSKSPFDRGEGHYLAPECEDSEADFSPRDVGRASDIWSFGCVLAEIATYMYGQGSIEVESFKTRRKVKINMVTTYTFHRGSNPNPGVQIWLRDLKGKASPFGIKLIGVVEAMLQIDPILRPSAITVTRWLRRLSLTSRYHEAGTAFDNVVTSARHIELEVEKQRYKLLGREMGLDNIQSIYVSNRDLYAHESAWATDSSFKFFHSRLEEFSKIVGSLNSSDYPNADTMRLQTLNSDLIQTLPDYRQALLQRQLEQIMVAPDNQSILEQIKRTFDESSVYRAIGTIAAIRQMHELYRRPTIDTGSDLRLNSPILRNRTEMHAFELASLVTTTERAEEQSPRVLIERIFYGGHWKDDLGDKLFARVGAIADLLRRTSKAASSSILNCMGFFHEPTAHAFALVFSQPQDNENAEAVSLRDLIEDSQQNPYSWPTRESRLKLARKLATTLFEIHTAGWMHKNISSFTILFFAEDSSPIDESLVSPYLIGFNHSRPNDPNAFSQKEETDQLDYRHPDYQQQQDSHFRTEYDYFSLGVVLLEIGLWRPLHHIMYGKEDYTPDQFLDIILAGPVQLLGFYMGEKYRKVVVACLKGRCEDVEAKGSADAQVGASSLGQVVLGCLDQLASQIP